MGNKTHTTILNESTVRDFNQIFLDKLKYKLRVLKKDTSTSIDDKVKNLQQSIDKYFKNIIERVNSYYSPLYKSITEKINTLSYDELLNYISNIEYNLYENLMKKLIIDKSVKLEAVDFNDKDLFNDLNELTGKLFDSLFSSLQRKEEELKDNNSSIKSIYNKFKGQPETPENFNNLKVLVIESLPDAINNSLNGIKSICVEYRKEYLDSKKLKKIIINGA